MAVTSAQSKSLALPWSPLNPRRTSDIGMACGATVMSALGTVSRRRPSVSKASNAQATQETISRSYDIARLPCHLTMLSIDRAVTDRHHDHARRQLREISDGKAFQDYFSQNRSFEYAQI